MTARWFFTRVGDVAEHEREAISARTNLYGRATTADFNTTASDAYPFLVATFIGWIWMLWRSEKLDGAQT
jgi:hypothetical protein